MAFKWRGFFRLRKGDSSSSLSLSDAEIPVDQLHPGKEKHKPELDTVVSSELAVDEVLDPKSVTFSTVQVRMFSRKLGDNPCCDFPLGLGWHYRDTEPVLVDDYDMDNHVSNPDYVYAQRMETMSSQERKEILMHSGYTSTRLRTEERRRRLQSLQEFLSQSDPGISDWLPPNSDVLVPRYLTERRSARWH